MLALHLCLRVPRGGQKSPQLMANGKWCINSPAPSTRAGGITLKGIFCGGSQSFPTGLSSSTHNGDLRHPKCSLGCLLPSQFPTSLLVLSGITSHINYLFANPCLKVCLCGSQLRCTSDHIIASLETLHWFLGALGIQSKAPSVIHMLTSLSTLPFPPPTPPTTQALPH